MRRLLVSLLVAGCTALGGDARELGALRNVAYGTIEAVHAVPIKEDDGERLVIRLDDGNRIVVVEPGWQGLRSGDRVRVLIGTKAARVERG